MAKSLLATRSKKKIKVTRTEGYLINRKYLGDEPILKDDYTNIEYGKALTWYNYMCTTSDAREYINEYLELKGRNKELRAFKSVPEVNVPTTAAWIARIMTNGAKLKQDNVDFFESKFAECLTKAQVVVEKKEEQRLGLTPQQRLSDRISDMIGDIEKMIDDDVKFSLYDWLKRNQIPVSYTNSIILYYAEWLEELLEAYEGKDQQLKEAYSYMTKKKLKERIVFFNQLIEDAKRYGIVVKKAPVQRKPRPVSIEKQIKHVQYQKEDKEFKLVSIQPEKIIGAKELWTFNTKYKMFTVLRSLDESGLKIKGTSIINYDESNSCTKRSGRKAEDQLSKVLKATKLSIGKILEPLKDAPLNYRLNENTILLKVVT